MAAGARIARAMAMRAPGEFHGMRRRACPARPPGRILGLMAAGDDGPSGGGARHRVAAGAQKRGWKWKETPYNAVGFPRVFYLKYHGYRRFFPLLALSRYKQLLASNDRQVKYGF